MKTVCLLLALASLSGCYQVSSSDADLRTVPVTNNPHVIQDPNRTNSMTSMGY